MKTLSFFAVAASVAPLIDAHYIFSQLIVNDKAVGKDFTYIRKNSNTYMPSYAADVIPSNNLRCNSGGGSGGATQTIEVPAGTKLGFKLNFNEKIEHPGPAFVYMSKAPGKASEYDGSGMWFKAFEAGLCKPGPRTDSNWCSWQKDRVEFTIPPDTPPGEYLVRPEHIAIHEGHVGKAQFYMECAQVRVTGNGAGNPAPLVRIPGVYSVNDPGIAYNKWAQPAPKDYVMPGPKVWSGGAQAQTGGAVPGISNPGSVGTGAQSGGALPGALNAGSSGGILAGLLNLVGAGGVTG